MVMKESTISTTTTSANHEGNFILNGLRKGIQSIKEALIDPDQKTQKELIDEYVGWSENPALYEPELALHLAYLTFI